MVRCLWPNGTKTRPLISSGFGPRNLSNPLASKYHRGTDFYGFPVVHSIADGVVVFVGWYRAVGWSSVAGYMVWVQHDGFFSRYLHNDPDTVRVEEGERVRAGQALIGMGWSGLANPWDSHSHVEVSPGKWHRGNTGQVDPVAFIQSRIDDSGIPAGIDLGDKPATPAPSGISINRSVKGDIMAESYVAAAGDKGMYPKGKVFYTRPGLKKEFKDHDDYHAWQTTINGLIDAGCSNQLRVPPLPEVKTLSDWRVKAILDANGV